MRVCARQLKPGELNHELIWLGVSLGSVTMAVTWFWLGLPWPHCVFHSLTGHPCLTCGATRSAIEFFHGHFFAALRWNPLVFVGLCGLVIFDLYAAIVLIFRSPRIRFISFSFTERQFVRFAVLMLIALNWVYLLSRPPGIF
jgi:Protein of unknown function (DUF2752)